MRILIILALSILVLAFTFFSFRITNPHEPSRPAYRPREEGFKLAHVKPGHWVSIPNTELIDILPESSFKQPIHKTTGPHAIVNAWSGGAYDSHRDRLMIIGGGHADYCGNEWLAFDLNKLKWELLSGPSVLNGYDNQSGVTPDGAPASRHTYNGLTYIPSSDELLMHGGSLCNDAGSADNRWWAGNPEDGTWKLQGGKGTWLLGYSTAYDEATDLVFEFRRGPLYSYSPATDIWLQRSTHGDAGKSAMTGAIDSARRKFLLLGQNKMYIFDLTTYERVQIETGSHPIVSANSPGLTYVKSIDRYVAWSGGKKLYLIHPVSWEIQALETSGEIPASATTHGTYGRFRYSSKYNGFILVNSIDSNVLFLKMPENTGDKSTSKGKTFFMTSLNKMVKQLVISPRGNDLPLPRKQIKKVKFGDVWCPDTHNSGENFHKVERYDMLPNDPIGDGENNCYMEALDTSIFSNNGKPVKNCNNLDMNKFPDHICTEVRTPKDFKSLSSRRKEVAIIMNNLDIQRTFEPYLASDKQSLVVIGTYDSSTKRPIIIKSQTPPPSTYFNWNVSSERSRLTLINLRMHGALCIQVSDRGKAREITGVSLTAKCTGRFIIAGHENDDENSKVDTRLYFKNILARAKNSHTIYFDRTYLNWIEDSIIMGPWISGKHAAKYTGQNVIIRNSLYSNQGVHGNTVIDPSYFDAAKPWLGKGGLAPISMASCNRALLDGITVVNHVVRGNSNPQPIQWQFRDALGAGCDMPRIYRAVGGKGPHKPFFGPVWYEGKLEETATAWDTSFWRSPKLLESYVINSQIVQTYGEDNPGHGNYYALMSDGTYPSVRGSSMEHLRSPADIIPNGWIERQRIHVSGNCLDNGVHPSSLFNNHAVPGMGEKGIHHYDNTNKFVAYGKNLCAETEAVAKKVVVASSKFLESLPQPPWESW